MKYSGRTTHHSHKGNDWREKQIVNPTPSVQKETIFYVQWTDCPVEVEAEVQKLWRWQDDLRNNSFFQWNRDEEHSISFDDVCPVNRDVLIKYGEQEDEDYPDDYLIQLRYIFPVIDEYLMSKGVEKCLINWWW